jgi:hypothetical protein
LCLPVAGGLSVHCLSIVHFGGWCIRQVQEPVTKPCLPLPWFVRAPESPSENLGSSWLASSPSALSFPRAMGSSASGPRGISRRTPRRSSPALARHLSGLPYRPSLRSGG